MTRSRPVIRVSERELGATDQRTAGDPPAAEPRSDPPGTAGGRAPRGVARGPRTLPSEDVIGKKKLQFLPKNDKAITRSTPSAPAHG